MAAIKIENLVVAQIVSVVAKSPKDTDKKADLNVAQIAVIAENFSIGEVYVVKSKV